jgi:hypothetical protein
MAHVVEEIRKVHREMGESREDLNPDLVTGRSGDQEAVTSQAHREIGRSGGSHKPGSQRDRGDQEALTNQSLIGRSGRSLEADHLRALGSRTRPLLKKSVRGDMVARVPSGVLAVIRIPTCDLALAETWM